MNDAFDVDAGDAVADVSDVYAMVVDDGEGRAGQGRGRGCGEEQSELRTGTGRILVRRTLHVFVRRVADEMDSAGDVAGSNKGGWWNARRSDPPGQSSREGSCGMTSAEPPTNRIRNLMIAAFTLSHPKHREHLCSHIMLHPRLVSVGEPEVCQCYRAVE